MTVQSFTPPPSVFPSTTEADEHGLVAVSAEMDLSLLIDAYCNGIFPWTEEPVCWFSPNPRAVFELDRKYVYQFVSASCSGVTATPSPSTKHLVTS